MRGTGGESGEQTGDAEERASRRYRRNTGEDPIDPMEQELPIEPMLKELPIDPIEQNEPIEPIDHALPIEPRESARTSASTGRVLSVFADVHGPCAARDGTTL